MILIAHRGNITGPIPSLENEPSYLSDAINEGFDVEIDLWFINNQLYLGHDNPQYKIEYSWLKDRSTRLWIHCKHLESMCYLRKTDTDNKLNYFGHDNDDYVLTSQNFLFCKPTKKLDEHCILVMPEFYNYEVSDENCHGILTDYPKGYINEN